MISALRHPLRRRVLLAYLDGDLECASAQEIAAAMDQPVGPVAYHLKTLTKCDLLRLVPAENGGGKEPRYGWALDVEAEWLRVVLEFCGEFELPR